MNKTQLTERMHLVLDGEATPAEAQALERVLTERQARRLRTAFRSAGDGAAEGFVRVLQAMIDREDRPEPGR